MLIKEFQCLLSSLAVQGNIWPNIEDRRRYRKWLFVCEWDFLFLSLFVLFWFFSLKEGKCFLNTQRMRWKHFHNLL